VRATRMSDGGKGSHQQLLWKIRLVWSAVGAVRIVLVSLPPSKRREQLGWRVAEVQRDRVVGLLPHRLRCTLVPLIQRHGLGRERKIHRRLPRRESPGRTDPAPARERARARARAWARARLASGMPIARTASSAATACGSACGRAPGLQTVLPAATGRGARGAGRGARSAGRGGAGRGAGRGGAGWREWLPWQGRAGRLEVCEPDVLRGNADEAPPNVLGALAGLEHPREPVQRRLRVRAPDRPARGARIRRLVRASGAGRRGGRQGAAGTCAGRRWR